MKYRLAILIFCFEAIVTTTAWSQAKVPAAAPAQTAGQDPSKASTPPEEPPPVLAVPAGYRYDVHGRRDPFVNPIPKPAPSVVAGEVKPDRPPGMKGALEADVTLLGVFVAKADPSLTRAILQIPGMRAPVMVSRGDVLYDAVIKEIRTDSVIFTMVAPGNKPRNPSEERDVIKKLRSTAGDKK